MKRTLTVATVLTWFNLILWGGFIALVLLGAFFTGQMAVLGGLVLMSAIPLTCYAGLKLHTSIRYPNVPLNNQTPVGIRFVGLMALFFGIYFVYTGIGIVGNPNAGIDAFKESLRQMPIKVQPGVENMAGAIVHLMAIALIVLGLIVAVNVILNLRLLRWYYLVHKSDKSDVS
jgi:hypothetical protein